MLSRIFKKYPLLRVYYKGILKFKFKLSGKIDGVRVMDEDWDNLIILDACRYDYFEKINWLNGNLDKRTSLGSHTEEWMEHNFRGDFPNTIYVSGNPYISDSKCNEKFGKVPFFKIENVWDYGWDAKVNWLPPESVTRAAVKTHKKYPEKKLIVHYLQPHWPFPPDSKISGVFLNSVKRKHFKKGFLWRISEVLAGVSSAMSKALKNREKKKGGNVWAYLREGKVDVEEARSSYEENIRIVLEEVEKILDELSGRTVISSDHGNLFGEYGIYGHPKNLKFRELIEVPWLEIK